MNDEFLIGVDIGTSGTKSVLFDIDGNTVASASREYPLYQPRNGWAEQDPEDWWKATYETINEIVNTVKNAQIKSEQIHAIGLSGQMHGLVMLDKNDAVIRPSIIWCDQRTQKECDQITEHFGRERLIELTANPALTGFTASKIKWIQNNEPEKWAKCTKIMLPKDYIRYKLTGEFATEVSDASGMQLLNVRERVWSKELLDYLEININQLGKVHESCEQTGKLTKNAAELCALSTNVIVAGGAGDQAASAVGNGIVKSGAASVTLGTSGVVFVHSDEVQIDKLGRVHTFCHAVPGAWHIMGVTQSAGLSFKWFRDNMYGEMNKISSEIEQPLNKMLDDIAEKVPCGSNGIIYLPYLMGERTPHLDPDARGAFFGLSAIHTRRDMLRSVLEGVIFSMKDCENVINGMGIDTATIFASGGGATSNLWCGILADVLGKTVIRNNSKESGALGVAILAGVSCGIYKSVPEACGQIIKQRDKIEPNEKNVKTYAEIYPLYDELYNNIKEIYKKMSKIDNDRV